MFLQLVRSSRNEYEEHKHLDQWRQQRLRVVPVWEGHESWCPSWPGLRQIQLLCLNAWSRVWPHKTSHSLSTCSGATNVSRRWLSRKEISFKCALRVSGKFCGGLCVFKPGRCVAQHEWSSLPGHRIALWSGNFNLQWKCACFVKVHNFVNQKSHREKLVMLCPKDVCHCPRITKFTFPAWMQMLNLDLFGFFRPSYVKPQAPVATCLKAQKSSGGTSITRRKNLVTRQLLLWAALLTTGWNMWIWATSKYLWKMARR